MMREGIGNRAGVEIEELSWIVGKFVEVVVVGGLNMG